MRRKIKRMLVANVILATAFVVNYLVNPNLKGEYTLGIIIVMIPISLILSYIIVRPRSYRQAMDYLDKDVTPEQWNRAADKVLEEVKSKKQITEEERIERRKYLRNYEKRVRDEM